MHVRITLSRVVLYSVNIQWQCMRITVQFHAKRFYLNRTHPVVLELNKRKKDKISVETQLIFFSIGFGYVFRIEPTHHQALIQNK
jgi:hypothetical protein